ncbi:RNA polymerase factor sigma-54 [Flavobacteriaceae bacterium]|jgi:RNA polymerase sigma-54 factor|nr:RNA polymerase factor sigma-54 [Flavobacteriaceae bacterium]MDA9879551.1 RNA polymerase factor sigma-54 [Flavobacteriaceae bacterium]MDB2328216.1 RNA polymerase factor sigma-54 [Flavobacteriaceae bacterium]
MLKQQLQIKLSQKLSPQQIKLMKLIQLSTLDLEQKIESEIGENPALESGIEIVKNENSENDYDENTKIETDEIDIDQYLSDDEVPAYRLYTNNFSSDDEDRTVPLSGGISFHQYLHQQMGNLILNDDEMQIAEFIIGSIDDSGYLRRTEDQLIDDLAFTQNIFVEKKQLEKIIRSVQSLDPPGVGARDLRECLQLQLEKKKKDRPELIHALKIIKDEFEHFSHKHYSKLQDRIGITEEELKKVLDIISRLNPKPGGALSSTIQNTHVVPDFIMTLEDGEIDVQLNRRNAPQLKISNAYKEMLMGYQESQKKSKTQQEAVQFIKQKLDSAKWFIEAIQQRHMTLTLTINAIVEHQKEYFLTGDERKLKPMILKDIADKVQMDISTISRVANSKYIDSPYGVKLLKTFFSEGLKNEEGEDVSSIEIKNFLSQLIAEENKQKPLTDDFLSKLMKEKGYIVARRTIAKYREQLDIPVARLRKEL